jgi:hypothetical protein
MHLGPKHTSMKPCRLAKAPDGPQVLVSDILRLQKEVYMNTSGTGQSLTLTENVVGGFILDSTLPADWTINSTKWSCLQVYYAR